MYISTELSDQCHFILVSYYFHVNSSFSCFFLFISAKFIRKIMCVCVFFFFFFFVYDLFHPVI